MKKLVLTSTLTILALTGTASAAALCCTGGLCCAMRMLCCL